MCGIAGMWSKGRAMTDQAVELLRHRGPDDCGRFVTDTTGGVLSLIHTRLAILDTTSAARQPMASEDGRYTLVYNGEIYNFRELRGDLEGKYPFRSSGDTEVLLRAYQEWGDAVFGRLDGMFAVAIWDALRQRLVLARDTFGIKPLYMADLDGGGVTFASELAVLLNQPGVRSAIRRESVAEFLTFLWLPEPHTMFEHIRKVPPGHLVEMNSDGRRRETPFADVRSWFADKRPANGRALAAAVQDAFTTSVRAQMVSDVPVGVFLSGGLDSTALALEMGRASPHPVCAHTVGFRAEDQKYELASDDLAYARRVATDLPNLAHRETILNEGSLDDLPRTVAMLGDPIGDPAAISTLLISEAVAGESKVVLSGMGAEEWWNGYARYWAALRSTRYWGKMPAPLQAGVRALLRSAPASRPGPMMRMTRQVKKFVRASGQRLDETFLAFESYYLPAEIEAVLRPGWRGGDPWARGRALFAEADGLEPLDQMTYVDAKTFLPSLNLAYTDRGSMRASIEIRVPILSNAMCRLAAETPGSMRLHGRVSKYALRQGLGDLGVPSYVTRRSKAGFGAPVRAWMARQQHPLVEDLLGSAAVSERGIVDPTFVEQMRQEHAAGVEDHGLRLYALMVLEEWFRQFVDGRGPSLTKPSAASGQGPLVRR